MIFLIKAFAIAAGITMVTAAAVAYFTPPKIEKK